MLILYSDKSLCNQNYLFGHVACHSISLNHVVDGQMDKESVEHMYLSVICNSCQMTVYFITKRCQRIT